MALKGKIGGQKERKKKGKGEEKTEQKSPKPLLVSESQKFRNKLIVDEALQNNSRIQRREIKRLLVQINEAKMESI